jgi:hypothetical protein
MTGCTPSPAGTVVRTAVDQFGSAAIFLVRRDGTSLAMRSDTGTRRRLPARALLDQEVGMLRHSSFALLVLGSMTAVAHADGPPAAAPEPGMTLRNGFSLSIGEEVGSGPSSGLTGQLYGVDWRIGAQVNEHLGAYLHTHLSLGTAQIGGASGYTGNFAAAIVGEYTLPAGFFVGAGGGYGVLNNPSGPLAELRAGWYPFEATGPGKSRRLNVAVDARWYFAGPNIGTVTHLAVSIGYDRF